MCEETLHFFFGERTAPPFLCRHVRDVWLGFRKVNVLCDRFDLDVAMVTLEHFALIFNTEIVTARNIADAKFFACPGDPL